MYQPLPDPPESKKASQGCGEIPTFWDAITDPFFKGFASYYIHRANHAREQVEQIEKAAVQPERAKQLEEQWTAIVLKATEYRELIRKSKFKNKNKAQLAALSLKSLVDRLTNLEKATATRARNLEEWQKKLTGADARWSEGIRALLSHQNPEARILYPGRKTQPCNVSSRKDALRAIISWLNGLYRTKTDGIEESQLNKRIFWLRGPPECGKSVIARHFAHQCEKADALAAGYVFEKGFAFEKHWSAFMSLLLSDWAVYLEDGFTVILTDTCNELGMGPDAFFKQSVIKQLNLLPVKAYSRLPESERKPMMVVLDDFDKMEPWTLRSVIEFISHSITKLPVHYFITSTTSESMMDYLGPNSRLAHQVMAFDLPLYDPQGEVDETVPQVPPASPKFPADPIPVDSVKGVTCLADNDLKTIGEDDSIAPLPEGMSDITIAQLAMSDPIPEEDETEEERAAIAAEWQRNSQAE